MKLKHFNHHLSYDEKVPKYVNSVIELNNRKTCGTELFFNYLLSKDNKLNTGFYKTFVESTKEQDTWDFKEESYNAKLFACTHSLFGAEFYIDLICSLDDNKNFEIPKLYDNLYKSDLLKQKFYVENINNNLLVSSYKNYKIGVTIAEQYRSIVGNELCKLRPELDFVMIINCSRNAVSLRCVREDIDLNQICLEFHHDGGGHKKAAGFTIDSESIHKIMKCQNDYLENLKMER